MAVVVIGGVNTDLIIRCPIIAGPGVTVIAHESAMAEGGKGGNQAAAVARLGGACFLVAQVGSDSRSDSAVGDLVSSGVDTRWIGRGADPTGLAVVQVDPSGENAITVVPGANSTLTDAHVTEALTTIFRSEDGVLLISLEIPLAVAQRAASLARRLGQTVVVNPAPATRLNDSFLSAIDVLIPNQHELPSLHVDGIEGVLAQGTRAVVETRGEAGCRVHRAGMASLQLAARRTEAVDTTGAGDAFCGALAWALDQGHPLESAARIANIAGALATRRLGARSALAGPDDICEIRQAEVL